MSIAHVLRTQFHQRAIDLVARNRAARDVDQAVRIAPEKSDHAILSVNRDAIAISILFGRRDNRAHRNVFEFSDALQNIAHLPPFNRKLMFVVDMLISASAATTKVWALRRNAMQRAFFNIDKFTLGELLFLAHNFRRDAFAVDCIWYENGLAVFTSDPFSAERDILNL